MDINTVCSACHTEKYAVAGPSRGVAKLVRRSCQEVPWSRSTKSFSTVKPLLDRNENEALQLQSEAYEALAKAKVQSFCSRWRRIWLPGLEESRPDAALYTKGPS